MIRQPLLTRPPVVIALVLICSLLWGSAFPLLKIGFKLLQIEENTGGKLYFAAYRFLLAGLMIFTGLAVLRKPVLLSRGKDYAVLLVVGLLQTTLQYILFYVGLSHTNGMKAAIIVGSGSLYLALFSHWWMGDDRLTKWKVIGLILGFTGIVLVNFRPGQLTFDFSVRGEGFLLLGALCSTLAILLVKKSSKRFYPPLMVAYQLTLGSIVLLIIAFGMEAPTVLPYTHETALLLIYLAFVSAVAFSLWYVLVKYNQLSKMAVYRFMIPVCGVFLSAAILATESLNRTALVALAFVSIGMVLTSMSPTPGD